MKKSSLSLLVSLLVASSVYAQPSTSVIGLGDKVSSAGQTRNELGIDKDNMMSPKSNRYSFKYVDEFIANKTIDTSDTPVYLFKQGQPKLNMNEVHFDFKDPLTHTVSKKTVADMLYQTRTDAFIVIKNGEIRYENYFDGQNSRTRHLMMSVTKSMTGMLAAMLVAEGKLNRDARVTDYIPELKDSAYGDATVGQVLDMTVGVKYSEEYTDPNAEISTYIRILGLAPAIKNDHGPKNIRQFLTTLKKQGEHGEKFHYVTPNTDVACWLSERASGEPFEKLLSDRVWSKMGMSRDAYVLVDAAGTASCGGGMNATAIDLAKVGEMLLNQGEFNGQQILPAKAVENITEGGDVNAFAKSGAAKVGLAGWSYKDLFWIRNNAHHAYTAIGIYGQWIYIDPTAKVVIVKQSSLPQADNDEVDAYTRAGFDAIINQLDK
ncbi:serine hydrolase [Pseudomonas lundensis]|uniref:serine hydrolase domain-containing protein n=1 Tax=Serratia proteamaculans TaxID=28151 RepID=UPI002981F29E|nr:serine hydrolase [Serratia proteamaculans]MDW5498177.1 serine hydrolase [Serratia proteamaculans]MDW5503235.1 serine hydrolase [Pseudomonas lundensis]